MNSVSARLPCHLLKGPLKVDFLDIYLTTSFRVRKLKNRSALRVIFFSKIFKIEYKFKKWKRNWEKVFRFLDNSIWKLCYKLCVLRREYLSSAVNGIANSPKILNITQRDFSTWIAFTVINKYGKDTVVQISTVFLPGYHVTCGRVFLIWTF